MQPQPVGLDRSNLKLKKAVALVRQGIPISKAYRRAGYAETTSKCAPQHSTPAVKKLIEKAQDDFIAKWIVHSQKIGYTPEYKIDTLAEITKT